MKKKVFYRVVLYAVAAFILLSATAVGVVYAFQDKIIQLFVAEANRHLKTKVEVSKIELSLWEKFPQVAISLDHVRIFGSLPEETTPLASGKRLYFTFNLRDIISGHYRVRECSLQNGQVFVKVNEAGQVNYLVFAEDSTKQQASEAFKFDLEKITLQDVLVEYTDESLQQSYQANARSLNAALAISDEKVDIKADGDLFVHAIQLENDAYFKAKDILLQTALTVGVKDKKVTIRPSVVNVGRAAYEVQGDVDYKNATVLDLKLKGRNTNIQSLLSLLPGKYAKQFSKYRSQGNVYFNGHIAGEASDKQSPGITFHFGSKNASFFQPEYKEKLENISLEGTFTNGKKRNLTTSEIELKNLHGTLRGKPFSGNLLYRNFKNPYLKLDAKAEFEIAHVLGIFPLEEIKSGNGLAKLQVNIQGSLSDFQKRPASNILRSSGELQLQNATLSLKAHPQTFQDLNGTFLLRRNDVAISDFTGKLGSSDFKLNGFFKNALGYVFLKDQPLRIEADFDADFLNFDELLAAAGAQNATVSGAKTAPEEYKLALSPKLDFDLNARIKRLQFRRFHSKNVKGTVRLKDQVVSSPNISLHVSGGKFSVSGSLDARSKNYLKVRTSAWLEDIRVDTLFYVFENFGQNFLQQRHLKGELTANIKSDLYFDSKLNPLTDKMEADINVTLVKGELINFEPMQKLSAFVDRSELSNLRFSELTNHFWIQDQTIYIPEMEIRSNVSRASVIGISGTHTFDQKMDYKFRIPLAKGEKKRDKDERFGNVEVVQASSGPTLFLTLKGSENNYKIAYDKERVKTKLKDDLRQEKQELVDALKGKKPEEKAAEIEQDQYFNF
ncbi:hypothetical protein I5M27_18305 [Adhaeribacter sp. BT258]|uniref:AsmA-like C-terminal domain-containing protein n=1 Tax=Adhaeribacter terrigena TaxID=2793070 RepID=A0ABS1C6F1_9BACT|nr:AsmA-like C-terminal region-containing protein [Adhaeribacter terrigena]MBK0404950.1 hypothetical protein [Adhaeribacter terrigena]